MGRGTEGFTPLESPAKYGWDGKINNIHPVRDASLTGFILDLPTAGRKGEV
jgi:hypothetical protein